jgi:hypothetical protein
MITKRARRKMIKLFLPDIKKQQMVNPIKKRQSLFVEVGGLDKQLSKFNRFPTVTVEKTPVSHLLF